MIAASKIDPVLFSWPPNYPAEKQRRIILSLEAERDRPFRHALMRFYADHPIEWINDFCVTFDPRKKVDKLMPFRLFKRQVEFVYFLWDCYTDRENGLCEKVRDAGVSWLCCAFGTWLWVFHPGSVVGLGSNKSENVDKPDSPKALFPKIRQILRNLPNWQMPDGFNWNVHSTHMKIINPANGAAIIGEAGDNLGRGGRTSIYIVDEAAHLENPEAIEAALGDNTDCRIDVSSVNGSGNPFYKRRMAGQVWHLGENIHSGMTRVFIFDKYDHPEKTIEWYEKRRARAEREGMMHILAQEVDRDYSAAIQGVIIPQIWVQAAIDAHKKLGFEPSGIVRAMQDVADGGGDKNAIVGGQGIVCQFAEHWSGEAGDAARRAVPICIEQGVQELYYDCIGVGVGFRVEMNTMSKEPQFPTSLKLYPWDAGATPMFPDRPSIPGDPRSPKNKDRYKNMKAQAWSVTRSRFWKTYQAVTKNDPNLYPHDELVSICSDIPRRHELCLELSQAVYKDTGEGKTVVDKKPDGNSSPNLADGFVGWLNPCKKSSMFD